MVEVFNLTNRRNDRDANRELRTGRYPTNPAATFNQITAVGDPRTLQFAVRVAGAYPGNPATTFNQITAVGDPRTLQFAGPVLEIFNLTNARASDIDYYCTSWLPGEPLRGRPGYPHAPDRFRARCAPRCRSDFEPDCCYHPPMRTLSFILICIASSGLGLSSQQPQSQPAAETQGSPQAEVDDPVRTLVGRLDLEKYKATIKGLTQFGDRRQGTDRNRAAVDWIEAQLKSYGCPTERIKYEYDPPPSTGRGRGRGNTGLAQGGGRPRGVKTPTGVNTDPMKQPDEKLRALNMQPTTPGSARGGVLHESRHDPPRRDVHRQRSHGRTRLGRSRERRWIGHGARHGTGARVQRLGRADRADDSLRVVEQRGNRIAGRARLR